MSLATDLVVNDFNGVGDVFVRDLQAGTTVLASVSLTGTSGNGFSGFPRIREDGRAVAFESDASNLTPNDQTNLRDVFVRDFLSATTTLASVNQAGTQSGTEHSGLAAYEGSRFVLFTTSAGNLVPNDGNFAADVYLRDLFLGTTTLISVNAAGTQSANGASVAGSISSDGLRAAFSSNATDLHPLDTDLGRDVFVRDLAKGTTRLVSTNAAGDGSANGLSEFPSITPDGRFVLFESTGDNLVNGDDNFSRDVFVRDLGSDTTILISRTPSGASGNAASRSARIGADGRFVVFQSGANDLVANDTNGESDVFLRDTRLGTTTLISANFGGSASGSGASFQPALGGNGFLVAFQSTASDLVTNDVNQVVTDVFSHLQLGDALSFHTVTQCRLWDTRDAPGPFGGPALAVGQLRAFTVAGRCGIPASARAVSVNLTVTGPLGAGYLKAFPGGVPVPLASTLNYQAGQTRANHQVLALGAGGTLAFQTTGSGAVHVLADADGYLE